MITVRRYTMKVLVLKCRRNTLILGYSAKTFIWECSARALKLEQSARVGSHYEGIG